MSIFHCVLSVFNKKTCWICSYAVVYSSHLWILVFNSSLMCLLIQLIHNCSVYSWLVCWLVYSCGVHSWLSLMLWCMQLTYVHTLRHGVHSRLSFTLWCMHLTYVYTAGSGENFSLPWADSTSHTDGTKLRWNCYRKGKDIDVK